MPDYERTMTVKGSKGYDLSFEVSDDSQHVNIYVYETLMQTVPMAVFKELVATPPKPVSATVEELMGSGAEFCMATCDTRKFRFRGWTLEWSRRNDDDWSPATYGWNWLVNNDKYLL